LTLTFSFTAPSPPEIHTLSLHDALPISESARTRVHLVTLPMEDDEENAIMVNALQRHARLIVQKSIAEGFGLTVAEAMWKGRPRSEEHTSELQSRFDLVCRLLLEKKKTK